MSRSVQRRPETVRWRTASDDVGFFAIAGARLMSLRHLDVSKIGLGSYAAELGSQVGISDCHCRKIATEYDRKPGIQWFSCTAK
jgi:hypothetical protein